MAEWTLRYVVVREYPGGRKLGWEFGSRAEAVRKFDAECLAHEGCNVYIYDRQQACIVGSRHMGARG